MFSSSRCLYLRNVSKAKRTCGRKAVLVFKSNFKFFLMLLQSFCTFEYCTYFIRQAHFQ